MLASETGAFGEDFRALVQLRTYLAGGVNLNGLDADVLRAFRHDAVRRCCEGK